MNAALLDLFRASVASDETVFDIVRARIASLGLALAGVAEPPASAPGAAIELEHRFERLDGHVFCAGARHPRPAGRPPGVAVHADRRDGAAAGARAPHRDGHHDVLTAVLNRRGLEQRLRVEWQRAERDGTALSLLRLEVEHLGRIDASHGHETADLALAMVAATCSEALRPTGPVRPLGRCRLPRRAAPGAASAAAADVAERLRARVGALDVPVHRADGSVRIGVHVGLRVGMVTARSSSRRTGQRCPSPRR